MWNRKSSTKKFSKMFGSYTLFRKRSSKGEFFLTQIFHNIWDTPGNHCRQVFYSWVRGDLKNISLNTSYITSNCPEHIWLETEPNKEKIAQKHLLELKKDLNCKLLLGLIIATQLNSLLIYFKIQQYSYQDTTLKGPVIYICDF